MSDLKDHLTDLLKHPGWRWFEAQIQAEWGAGGRRFDGFINNLADSRADDALTLRQIQQIAVARREILRALKAPSEALARLTQLEQPVDTHPRPPMERDLVGQSRRGGL